MLLLVVYLIINIVISEMLDRSKHDLYTASIIHAVAFSVIFPVLLIAQGSAVDVVMSHIFDEPLYITVRSAIITGIGVISSPLTVFEMIIPIIATVVAAILTVKAVIYVRAKLKKSKLQSTIRRREYTRNYKVFSNDKKLYLINCVMLC